MERQHLGGAVGTAVCVVGEEDDQRGGLRQACSGADLAAGSIFVLRAS
ncbi:MAG: hypothetical protein ACI8QS_001754 [Planctomycetota bacterium]|jgi:hypothetical protein